MRELLYLLYPSVLQTQLTALNQRILDLLGLAYKIDITISWAELQNIKSQIEKICEGQSKCIRCENFCAFTNFPKVQLKKMMMMTCKTSERQFSYVFMYGILYRIHNTERSSG